MPRSRKEALEKAIEALNALNRDEKTDESLETILQAVSALEIKINDLMSAGNPALGPERYEEPLTDENDEKFPKGLNPAAEELDEEVDDDEETDENVKAEYMNDELTAEEMQSPEERAESSSDFPANDESSEIDYGNSGAIPLSELQKLSKESKELRKIIKKKNLNFKELDGKLTSDLSFNIVKAKPTTSNVPGEPDYIPTPSQYKKINETVALKNYPPEHWRVFTGQAADMKVDRGFEHFSQKALDKMLALAIKNKIPFLTDGDSDHQWRQKNIYGVVFDGNTEGGTLNYSIAIPVIEKTKNVLDAIMSGLYNKLSVGFALDPQNYICDSCGKSMFSVACAHMPGGMDNRTGKTITALIDDVVENFEVSGVAVPMQPEAHIRQSYSMTNTLETFAKSITNTVEKSQLDKISNGISTTEDNITMADEALNVENKGDIDPVGHVPTPAETGPTVDGIRVEKKVKLGRKIDKAVKNTKQAVKESKKTTEALTGLVNAINNLYKMLEETKKSVDACRAGSLKSFETVTVAESLQEAPVRNRKSWINNYLGDASDLVGGQE